MWYLGKRDMFIYIPSGAIGLASQKTAPWIDNFRNPLVCQALGKSHEGILPSLLGC